MSKSSQVQYYSVPEFAELAGVSKQAVYDRIKKDLAGYTVKDGGKTMISGDALPLVGNGVSSQSSGQVKIAESKSSKGLEQGLVQVESSKPLEQVNQALEQAVDSSEKSSDQSNKSSESKVDSIEKSSSQSSKSSESKVDSDFLNYLIKENARLIAESERKDAAIAEKDRELHSYYERVMGLTEQLASLAEREQDIASKALNTTGQAQLLHAMSGDQSDVLAIGKGNTLSEETQPEKPKKSPWWKRDKKQK